MASSIIKKDNIGIINGTFTPESGFSASEVVVRQYGKVVNIKMYVTADSAFPTGQSTTIGTVSGVSMPTNNIRTICSAGVNAFSAAHSAYSFLKTSNGDIDIRPSVNTDTVVLIDFTYIIS